MKEQGKEGSNCDKKIDQKYCLICCLIERKESVKSIGGREFQMRTILQK